MWITRDLVGGQKPSPIELYYCTNKDSSTSTKRYKGSLVKLTNFDNSDGNFFTWCGETTVYENTFGILMEEILATASGDVLPNHTTASMTRRKIRPILPSSVCRAEYSRNDPAGNSNVDVNISGSAAAIVLVDADTIANAYSEVGGWFYFIDGANANYLHYIESHTTSTEKFTLGTALTGAVTTSDEFLYIAPAACTYLMMDAQEVTLVSEKTIANRTMPVMGLMNYITDIGIPHQPLDRAKHDGLKLVNPRFYHDFILIGNATLPSAFFGGDGIVRS